MQYTALFFCAVLLWPVLNVQAAERELMVLEDSFGFLCREEEREMHRIARERAHMQRAYEEQVSWVIGSLVCWLVG